MLIRMYSQHPLVVWLSNMQGSQNIPSELPAELAEFSPSDGEYVFDVIHLHLGFLSFNSSTLKHRCSHILSNIKVGVSLQVMWSASGAWTCGCAPSPSLQQTLWARWSRPSTNTSGCISVRTTPPPGQSKTRWCWAALRQVAKDTRTWKPSAPLVKGRTAVHKNSCLSLDHFTGVTSVALETALATGPRI